MAASIRPMQGRQTGFALIRTLQFVLMFAIAWMIVPGIADASTSEKRVALVVGNGAYKNVIQLPNPPNDAKAIADALRRLDFKVIEAIDADHDTMNSRMREFANALEGADVGLFFYAGHGLQVNGENYVVPIDAALKTPADLDFETFKIGDVLKQLDAQARVKLVILDACRNNPLAEALARSLAKSKGSLSRSATPTSGLAAPSTTAKGTVIAFATAPGTTALDGEGAHSPFTQALLSNLETPGIDVEIMLKRVKADVAKLTQDGQSPWVNSSLDAEFALNPAAGAAGQAGEQQVASVTPATSGSGTAAQGSTMSEDTKAQIELEKWKQADKSGKADDYNAYLKAYPTGTFADTARSKLEALQAAAPIKLEPAPSDVRELRADQETETGLNLTDDDRREIQSRLSLVGFGTRGIDGVFSNATRNAFTQWQKAVGLVGTGYLNGKQLELLKSETENVFRSWTAEGKPAITDHPTATASLPPPITGQPTAGTQTQGQTGTATRHKQAYATQPRVSGGSGAPFPKKFPSIILRGAGCLLGGC